MKKYVLAFILTSLLLTGCGSATGTAESSTPDASQASHAVAEQKEESKNADSSESAVEAEVYDWNGIDMPIPVGMEEHVRSRKRSLRCWFDGQEEEAVYYVFGSDGFSSDDPVTKLPENLIRRIDDHFSATFESSTLKDYSRMIVDESAEVDFMGFPAYNTRGTVSLNDGTKLNYSAYYAYLDFPEDQSTHTPSFWMAFTSSDSKDALDRMEKAAALPLTQAKLHATD